MGGPETRVRPDFAAVTCAAGGTDDPQRSASCEPCYRRRPVVKRFCALASGRAARASPRSSHPSRPLHAPRVQHDAVQRRAGAMNSSLRPAPPKKRLPTISGTRTPSACHRGGRPAHCPAAGADEAIHVDPETIGQARLDHGEDARVGQVLPRPRRRPHVVVAAPPRQRGRGVGDVEQRLVGREREAVGFLGSRWRSQRAGGGVEAEHIAAADLRGRVALVGTMP